MGEPTPPNPTNAPLGEIPNNSCDGFVTTIANEHNNVQGSTDIMKPFIISDVTDSNIGDPAVIMPHAGNDLGGEVELCKLALPCEVAKPYEIEMDSQASHRSISEIVGEESCIADDMLQSVNPHNDVAG